MAILVTGGAGYIGSHCVLSLFKNKYDVIIFDNLSTGHIETVNNLKKYGKLRFYNGDLLNTQALGEVFKENDIEAVIHFAAFSQVNESVTEPSKYYMNNIIGSLNLLDAMVAAKINKIIFSSTASVYGEPQYTPIDENHPQLPINPYGKTKLMIEKILDDYDKAYGISSVRLRYFNAAGADEFGRTGEIHEPETHLIPSILQSTFSKGKTFELFGTEYKTKDGTCVRDYINVEDLAQGHILALKYLENGGKSDFFNLGTNTGNTVKEVFDICEEITGQKIPVITKPGREGDCAVLIADNSKAKKILNWEPLKDLKTSIKTAYDFEKSRHLNG